MLPLQTLSNVKCKKCCFVNVCDIIASDIYDLGQKISGECRLKRMQYWFESIRVVACDYNEHLERRKYWKYLGNMAMTRATVPRRRLFIRKQFEATQRRDVRLSKRVGVPDALQFYELGNSIKKNPDDVKNTRENAGN